MNKLALSLARAILRPKSENEQTIQDSHPTRMLHVVALDNSDCCASSNNGFNRPPSRDFTPHNFAEETRVRHEASPAEKAN